MARTPLFTSLSFFFTLFFCITPFDAVHGSKGSLEWLKVPHAEFANSVKEVIGVLHSVTSALLLESEFVRKDGGYGAVSACLELMELSSDELNRVVSVIESPKGKQNGTGNLSSDLRTWLSAVLANTETCMEGLLPEETSISSVNNNNNVKNVISSSINKVNTMVHQLLTQVHPVYSDNYYKSQQHAEFPYSWCEKSESEDLDERKELLTVVDAVVALDGSGNHTSVKGAVERAPEYSMKRYVIHIKKGVYTERVEIDGNKWNIVIIGDGMDNTIITGNWSHNHNNVTTYFTATFAVKARGFVARDISFHNTAGPRGGQAVALRSYSDLSVFYRCGISGYQDSLYAHASRQFYRECIISGTVDFIFGRATAVFQNCTILAKKPLPDQTNTITAQGANDSTKTSGFSFQFCNISAHSELLPFVNSTRTYLGRPWKKYSRTVFMQSYMSEMVSPEGWKEWNGSSYLDTLYYGEFLNYGPGSGLSQRVKWAGYHVMNGFNEASNFTVAQFILGDLWLPSTGKETSTANEECIEWLNLKDQIYVLYISLGSQNTISTFQMMALAEGLEKSETSFIWVIRPPLGFDINGEFKSDEWLPKGFEERMKSSQKGLLVHQWGPQMKILSHKSIAAFLSHCGWNSVLESLSCGVPIIGWPLAAEQAHNATMLEEELGVGVILTATVESVILGEEVKDVIEMVMNQESGKGKEIKVKTKEIAVLMTEATQNGEVKGSSVRAMDDFVRTILSKKNV